MTVPSSADADRPRILSLGANRSTVGQLSADVVDELTRSRLERGLPAVAITCDVDDMPLGESEAAAWRELLVILVGAACDASAGFVPPRGVPCLREVLVTGVVTPDGLELEVADSGPGLAAAAPTATTSRLLASARPLAERLGGTLAMCDCPSGGLAVTIHVPRRRVQRCVA